MKSTTRFSTFSGSCVVVNQLAQHYLAAKAMLSQSRTSPYRDIWLYSVTISSCVAAIENVIGRIAELNDIKKQEKEKNKAFRTRVLASAGIHLRKKASKKLKELIDYWNRNKHSGKGEEWKSNAAADTEAFAVEALNFAGALLSAFYRWRGSEPDWIERAEPTADELRMTAVRGSSADQLIDEWSIELRR